MHDSVFFKTKAHLFYFLLPLLALILWLPAGVSAAEPDTTDIEIIGTFGQTEARTMLDMVNEFRSSSEAWYWNEKDTEKVICTGLNDYIYDYELEQIAMQRAAEIAVFYSHTRPDGSSCFTLQDESQMALAENIAIGSGSALDTAEEAYLLWREDRRTYSGQGHRRNMLSDTLTHIGIGHFYYNGMHCWVQEFSSPGYGTSETPADDQDASFVIPVLTENIRGLAISISETSFDQKAGTVRDLPLIVPWTATFSDEPTVNYGMPVYNASLSIESSDESIAWVSDGQIFTADDADGTVTFTVTATLGSFTATTTFTVNVYTKLSLENGSIRLSYSGSEYTGKEQKPGVTVRYNGTDLTEGTDYILSYDEDMVNCGTKVITATGIGEYKGTLTANFTIRKRSYIGVVSFRYGSITVGKTEAIYVVSGESYLKEADVIYESADPSIATVDENGRVTGVGEGITEITITFLENQNYTETVMSIQYSVSKIDIGLIATVRVNDLPLTYNGSDQKPSVTVTTGTETLVEGQDYTLTYPDDSKNAGTKELVVTGFNRCKGSKTVSYEIGKAYAEFTPSFPAELQIAVGETAKITASAPTKISYSVYRNPSVVSVSSDGTVKGLSSGRALIELTSNASDNYDSRITYCSVVVSSQPSTLPTGIRLNPSSVTLAVGKTADLTAVITPSNASNKTVTWESSKPGIVSVDQSGQITALKYGKEVITAQTTNGLTASCSVQTLFKDVTNSSKSYYNAVYWAVDKGITRCTTTFKPENGVTRGEFTAFLYRLAKSPDVTASMKKAVHFSDVTSDTKFYKEICWAVNKGVIKGFSDGTFRPNDGLTRAQCAIMIWRYAGKPQPSAQAKPFPDVPVSKSDTSLAVLWGSENNIIKGSNGYFLPKDPCTRANVVTFLYRYTHP